MVPRFGDLVFGEVSQIPICVYQKSKARQLVLTGLIRFETGCATRLSGGGGDRTRVPRHFHDSFYVCSRIFGLVELALTDEVQLRRAENFI